MESIQYLVEDVIRLPIITNPHQELWLGVQLQADHRLALIQAEWAANPTTASDSSSFLWQALLSTWGALEQACSKNGLPVPRFEAWAADLLAARRNIYQMRRSRMRRFIHQVKGIDPNSSQQLLELAYTAAETLTILPNNTLDKLIEFVSTHNRLPFISEINSWPPLEPTILEEHARRQVDQTQQILTTGYLRYAMRVAQAYIGQGVPYADLVQAGFIGLFRAASKFDYRVQARFGTYATSWVWQAIGREIADQGCTIRLPVHMRESLHKWRAACDLYDDGLQDPTLNPLALLHAGLLEQADHDEVQKLKYEDCALPSGLAIRYEEAISKARKLRASDAQVFSLSQIHPVTLDGSNDGVVSVEELMPDEGASLDDIADIPYVRQLIEGHIFACLTNREREVLMLRCGWQDGEERTLEEIGSQYSLTRERIRQIEVRARKKLARQQALGLLPNLQELLPQEDSLPSWQPKIRLISPSPERVPNKDSTELNLLDELLSQLPRSDWIQGRRGVQSGQRQEQLVAALEQLAVPAHISDITEQLSGSVEGKELEDAHVYALLIRDEEAFILLGQSIFSLVHWERDRAKEHFPVLPCCPMPLPDPPDYEDSFFESVLVGQEALAQELTAGQFLSHMFNWAKTESEPQKWFAQTVLSAYYLVDLVPYTFYFGGENPILQCTLPKAGIQELRYHCLKMLTGRLVTMPEFWWLLQQNQPIRPADLGEQFADIHPYGLDDVLQRLRLLASLGAAQKLKYGEYRLTSLGEACANRWKREAVVETTIVSEIDLVHDFSGFVEW